jgi:hypothetical protein
MCTTRYFLTTFALLGLLGSQMGCKKKEDVDPSKGLSTRIQNIVPAAALADLKAKGMIINEGTQPPNIEGIYLASPYRVLAPYGPNDSYAKGRVLADYKYRFYEQTGEDIKINYKGGGATGTGTGAFVSGFGNKFTLFVAATGNNGAGATYKSLEVYTGEISTGGIINYQDSFMVTEKNDPNNTMLPVNQARVLEDGDGLASRTTTFRMAAEGESNVPTGPAKSAARQ